MWRIGLIDDIVLELLYIGNRRNGKLAKNLALGR